MAGAPRTTISVMACAQASALSIRNHTSCWEAGVDQGVQDVRLGRRRSNGWIELARARSTLFFFSKAFEEALAYFGRVGFAARCAHDPAKERADGFVFTGAHRVCGARVLGDGGIDPRIEGRGVLNLAQA